jgi:putative ATPase
LEALDDAAARGLIARALAAEGAAIDDDAIDHLAARANGDGRHTLTSLEVAITLARGRVEAAGGGPVVVTLAEAEAALGTKALRYGRDDHYDVISAFIKSIRGSDVDAGLYWLATMLEAGEDARFIARRLVILASEDVGEADPLSLLVATAAAQAVEYVGLPEAQLNLAQAVVHLAAAPKSNAVTTGIGRARADVREQPSSGVPAHLRDAHYQGAAKIGHGDGYEYPHDDPRGWVPQEYRPPEVAHQRYYVPTAHGREREIADRMARLRHTEPPEEQP